MSTITDDPVDRLLDAAQSGKTLIKNRDVLHFTHMPEQILHRDPEQEKLKQKTIPLLILNKKFLFYVMAISSYRRVFLYADICKRLAILNCRLLQKTKNLKLWKINGAILYMGSWMKHHYM